MKEVQIKIIDPVGLHARPAAIIVTLAKKYTDSKIELIKDNHNSIDMKSIMSVIGSGVKFNDVLTLSISGGDEAAIIQVILETATSEKIFEVL